MNEHNSDSPHTHRRREHGRLARLTWFAAAVGALIWMLQTFACTSLARARHFNEGAAAPESRAQEILRQLAIIPGSAVADLGTGGGYFAYLFADAVGKQGTVYATDVDAEQLAFVAREAGERGHTNIRRVQAPANGSGLPEASVDLVFVRNVYHHLEDRPAYFRALQNALRRDARVVVIDYAPDGGWSFVSLFGHTTSPQTIRTEMDHAGYRLVEDRDFLQPRQSYQVFAVADVK